VASETQMRADRATITYINFFSRLERFKFLNDLWLFPNNKEVSMNDRWLHNPFRIIFIVLPFFNDFFNAFSA
jgi:hypothetical protein